jgi:hypothetical protein
LLLSEDPKRLQQRARFLSLLLEQKILEPFKPVLEKVIQRYLLEEEMRKKYGVAVAKRYLDFGESGRSPNFGWNEIEEESKNTEEIIVSIMSVRILAFYKRQRWFYKEVTLEFGVALGIHLLHMNQDLIYIMIMNCARFHH